MKIEEQLRTAIHDYTDRIHTDPAAWSRIHESMTSRPPHRWRSVAVASVAAAALLALIAVRVIADRPQGLKVVTPSVNDSTDQQVLTTPDGDWELRFPKDWHLQEGRSGYPEDLVYDSQISTAAIEHTDEWAQLDGEILIHLSVVARKPAGSGSTNERPMTICGGDSPTIMECTTQSINGRTWGRADASKLAGRNVAYFITMFLTTPEREYEALAIIYGSDNLDARIAQVEQIFSSFVIRDPS